MFDVYIKYKVGGEVNSGEDYYYTEQAAGAGRMYHPSVLQGVLTV